MQTPTTEAKRVFDLQNKQTNLQRLKNTSAGERLARIRKLENYLLDKNNKTKFITALYEDLRKPEEESIANELVPVLMNISHIKKHLNQWMSSEKVDSPISLTGLSSYIKYEPKGIVLILSPWNYPFQLTLNPLLYAIAAGNAVVLKPSEFSQGTSGFVSQMVKSLYNENEVAVLEGESEMATALLELPFNHIFFTGSPAVGKIVMKAAAVNLTSITLELGGKSPVIVDETYNIKTAAYQIAWGKTMNAGQTCIAPDYLLIHESKKVEFINYYRNAITKFYNSDNASIEQSPYLARIINSRNVDRIKLLLEDALSKGAKVVCGGEIDSEKLYIAPTILDDVTTDMKIMQEEIFGPILPLISYTRNEDAVALINSLPKPLAFYILSKSKANTNYFLNNSSAGGTCINELMLTTVNQNLPFGGVNNSGFGKSNGKYSFIDFSNERGVIKRKWGTLSMLYPPYNKTIINWLIKIARL
jgi:aldehyde dehydrogenase (NAD+)